MSVDQERRRRPSWRYVLADWRVVATWAAVVGGALLLALLAAALIDSSQRARAAVETAAEISAESQQRTETVRRRIDRLNGRIADLSDELEQAHATIARLETQIDVLTAQIEAAGQDPPTFDSSSASTSTPTTTPDPPADDCSRRNPQGHCTDPNRDKER